MSVIFALVDPQTQHVFHVGCAIDPEKQIKRLPTLVAKKVAELAPSEPLMVILQSADVHPRSDWVKWSKRFRRDLATRDWELCRDLGDAFTNSAKTKRALGQRVDSDVALQKRFHRFDRQHPNVFDEILRISREKQAQGNKEYGIDAIVTKIRWRRSKAKRVGRHKIPNAHNAFYARKVQMIDPSLCGFFAVVECAADNLVLDDGHTWLDFVREHRDQIRYIGRGCNSGGEGEGDAEWIY
jgi:hypothetical protein